MRAKGKVDEAALEQLGESIAGRDGEDFLLRMDRRQSDPEIGAYCPKGGKKHGLMQVTAGAAWLMCATRTGGKCCEERVGITRGAYEGIDENGRLPGEPKYQAPRPAEVEVPVHELTYEPDEDSQLAGPRV